MAPSAEKLLIIGKQSYIGGYLADYATCQGREVITLSSKDCNFLDAEQVSRLFRTIAGGAYVIFFLAVVNKNVSNSYESFLKNLHMVRNLIRFHASANIKSIIYFSSVDVYGKRPTLPLTEDSPVNPDTWYGLAKYVCEQMLKTSDGIDCPVTILRLPGLYGRAIGEKSVVDRMALSIVNDKRVTIKGSGKVLRDYVFIEDLSRLLMALIDTAFNGIINVAAGHSLSILDIADVIGRTCGVAFDVVYGGSDEQREFDLIFDNRNLSRIIMDFKFADMTDGIRATFLERQRRSAS